MSLSARKALERDATTWPLWQQRLLFGRRWPVRVMGALCLAVVLVSELFVPLNGAVVLAAHVLLVACAAWVALADALTILHFSITMPAFLPSWLRWALDMWWRYPCRLGAALGFPLMDIGLLTIPAFPSVPGSALANGYLALLLISLAPVMLSVLVILVMVAAVIAFLPFAIVIGIVRSIRNRRERRYRQLYRDRRLPQW